MPLALAAQFQGTALHLWINWWKNNWGLKYQPRSIRLQAQMLSMPTAESFLQTPTGHICSSSSGERYHSERGGTDFLFSEISTLFCKFSPYFAKDAKRHLVQIPTPKQVPPQIILRVLEIRFKNTAVQYVWQEWVFVAMGTLTFEPPIWRTAQAYNLPLSWLYEKLLVPCTCWTG